jgi:hypothetical protein
MAKVYLRIDGGREIVDLPPVCMKCGAPATVRKSKQFSWVPPSIAGFALIPVAYAVLALVMTKRQRVETTFCDRHSSYWWLYPLILWIAVVGIVGFGVVLWIAAMAAAGPGRDEVGALPCLGIAGGVIVLAIVAAIINNSRIRPKEITDRHIYLDGVCAEFADAVEDEEYRRRRAFDRDDDDERRPRRPRQDDDYERRPRRPRQDDDDRYTQ